ncbi:MAG: hypothetical protein JXK94_07495 [Deltaproteobacteria bacterium]|nr:hypothetical protein [Deltaproteobacteria bacterium]
MPFKKILGKITWEYPGKCGAILIDSMGESVDMTGTFSPYRLRAAGAHQGIVAKNLGDGLRRLVTGDLEEIQIVTDNWLTYMIPVDRDYTLVCMFEKSDVELGKFLRAARNAIPALKKEMY